MTASVLVKLTLIRKPEPRAKRDGVGEFTYARAREGFGDGARLWTLFVYNQNARDEIDRLDVGDIVTVQGSFAAEIWAGRGKPEVALKITVDRALALKPAPRTRAHAEQRATTAPATKAWDDELPF